MNFVPPAVLTATLLASTLAWAQLAPLDPGTRAGIGAGEALPGLTAKESRLFDRAHVAFAASTSVSGKVAGEQARGLGPRFNHNSCAGCHAYPTAGGSSPAYNPQIDVAVLHGAHNVVPPFITARGPVRVARFVQKSDGTPDGGVHPLFVISGRADAPGCNIAQPDFAAALAANNVVFRIPTALYGLGLVEATPDANLRTAFDAQAELKKSLGVDGRFHERHGTIARFGWKAHIATLVEFAGEALSVEHGVTNKIFPNEDEDESIAACRFQKAPEESGSLESSAAFTRLLAPPKTVSSDAARRGAEVFNAVGCQTCHIAAQTTGPSSVKALSNVTYHPYSDFALHDMGVGLNDRVTQGNATGREWRTTPLWGVGQRLFFLHDGQTSDLVTAITAHASPGSEANGVLARFDRLSRQQTADLLAFLRSL